tara:strand:- start:9012 stop:9239 length:228 start_codon:yes stop_codon:yes gene_type:complete
LAYLVLKGCVINGQKTSAGDVVDSIGVDEKNTLLAMQRIEEVSVKPAPVETNRSVGLEESDGPAPKRRRRIRSAD